MYQAQFDEQARAWVADMELPQNEKDIRAEIISYMAGRFSEIKEPEDKDNLLLMAALALTYKTVYIESVNLYFSRYVEEMGGHGVSEFSKAWLKRHAEEFALYPHDSDPMTIAATETGALGGLAELDGFYQRGYSHKFWKSERDSRVRQTHRAADGQVRRLEEPFIVGGYRMMFPQDASLGAPAKEIVHCRCIMTPVK